jgi:hypothetical protein
MTTVSGAFDVIKARLTAGKPEGLIALFWQNEDSVLPDTPTAFVYSEFITDPALLASFGGGRGRNRYRNPGRIDCYVFVPRGEGLTVGSDLAEAVAALFRSYRDDVISCFEATVYPLGNGSDIKPPGLVSEVNNYYCVLVEVSLFFDLIG